MICIRPTVIALLGLTSFQTTAGVRAADIKAWLERPILDSRIPQKQVEEFCAARVPRMPEIGSLQEWENLARKMRRETLDQVVFRGEAAAWRKIRTKYRFVETIPGGPEYRIRKLVYEVVPGVWIPGLMYEPNDLQGKVPVVLNLNGHDRKSGKAADYKQIRCINQAKRGMIALNLEWVGMGQLQTEGFSHYRMNQLDLCGTSGLAPFYLSMSRGLDLLLEHPNADPARVAVAGLSGGGWQTIIISALDERVTLSDPVAGYSSFLTRIQHHSDLGDSEQTPVDLGVKVDYTHLTAMLAPRPALLTFNLKDNCCFASPHALPPLLAAARPVYRLYGKSDSLQWHVNEDPGTHNFGKDNRQALYRMLGAFFYAGDTDFDAVEIACGNELKTVEELSVPLPGDNGDFHSLALKLSKSLPREPAALSADPEQRLQAQRASLRSILKFNDLLDVTAMQSGEAITADGLTVTPWKIHTGKEWTVPALEIAPEDYEATTVLLGDAGRRSLEVETRALLQKKHRVIACDPFYFGESKIVSRDFLFALCVSAVGSRPLGIQAAQVNAVRRWAAGTSRGGGPVHVQAHGPRTSLMALCAAAVDGQGMSQLHLFDELVSLKDILRKNIGVNQQPELFCFGLLEYFDIPLLKTMASRKRLK